MDLQARDAKGVREDISDIIIELEAEETPAFSLIPKGEKPGAPIMQQPVDAPGFASRTGVRNKTPAKGAVDQSKSYDLLESNNHWIRQEIGVGKKDEITANRAGVGLGKLYAKETAKGIKAVKVAIESVTLDNFDQRDEAGGDGSETRGAYSWGSPTAQACRAVPEKYRPAAGQRITTNLANITPDTLMDAFDARWLKTKRANRLIGFCGNSFKRHVSGWSMYMPNKEGQGCVREFDQTVAAGKKERVLQAIIDILEFDTGSVELHMDPYNLWDRRMKEDDPMPAISQRACIMFSPDGMKYHFAQNVEHESLPYDGGSTSGQITTMFHTMAKPFDMITIMPAA